MEQVREKNKKKAAKGKQNFCQMKDDMDRYSDEDSVGTEFHAHLDGGSLNQLSGNLRRL